MRIKEAEFVVFDVETTGLDPDKQDKICEIGAVKVSKGRITDSFSSLVNPKRTIPEEVVKIHGITQPQVDSAPCFKEVSTEFLKFVNDLPLTIPPSYPGPLDLSEPVQQSRPIPGWAAES